MSLAVDVDPAELIAMWREAIEDDVVAVRIFCADCRGTRRGLLGRVHKNALMELELVVPPRPMRADPLPGPFARGLLGWRQRGEPDAPTRVASIGDTWVDDAFVRGVYCGRHGGRMLSWAELRDAYRKFARSGKTANVGA